MSLTHTHTLKPPLSCSHFSFHSISLKTFRSFLQSISSYNKKSSTFSCKQRKKSVSFERHKSERENFFSRIFCIISFLLKHENHPPPQHHQFFVHPTATTHSSHEHEARAKEQFQQSTTTF